MRRECLAYITAIVVNMIVSATRFHCEMNWKLVSFLLVSTMVMTV